MSHMSRKITLGLIALAVIFMAGCATARKTPEIVWPLPPETPRIKYVKSISAVEDIRKKSIFTWIKEILVGKDPTARLGKPYAVHARGGRIYVADSAWKKVLVFDTEKHDFFILGLEGPGVLAKPLGVTTDSQGRIYVTDTVQNRAVVYDKDGNFLYAIGEAGRFDQPVGIAVYEPLKRIYIVDTRKHNVSVFDMEGKFLFEFGGRGTDDGKLNFPTNISIDKEGKLYVMDTFNFRVQIFDPDGKLLNKFGGIGTGVGQFSKPKGIGVDSEGHIYVVDAAFNNVQIFNQQGQLLLFFGEFGNRPWQFWLPAGLYIDEHDQIYVADQYNKKINIYQYLPEKPASNTGKGSQQAVPKAAVGSAGIGGVTVPHGPPDRKPNSEGLHLNKG